jgi:hypothetical protein
MAVVNWYRQSQKHLLLQKVLSHSLASTVHLYPRFLPYYFFSPFVVLNLYCIL